MQIDLKPGDTELARLMDAAESGEEVILARAGRPAVKLVVVPYAPQGGTRIPGRLKGKLHLPKNWAEEFDKMDEEITHLMVDAPLTTDGNI